MAVGITSPVGFSMRVSARAHYGLRMMTEFAKAHGEGPLSIAEVARTEHLSLPYLEQLAVQLRRGGLVESTRGVRGGYSLTRAPEEISVLDVITVIEGEVAPVECVAHTYEAGSCAREADCASRALWLRIKRSVDAILSQTTLAELVADRGLVDTLAPAEPGIGPAPQGLPGLGELAAAPAEGSHV